REMREQVCELLLSTRESISADDRLDLGRTRTHVVVLVERDQHTCSVQRPDRVVSVEEADAMELDEIAARKRRYVEPLSALESHADDLVAERLQPHHRHHNAVQRVDRV